MQKHAPIVCTSIYKEYYSFFVIVLELNTNKFMKYRCEKLLMQFQDNNNLIYRVSQEECARLQEGVPYVKVYRYNPNHLCPKLNGYGDNGQRSLKL